MRTTHLGGKVGNLPADSSTFVGRHRETVAVSAELHASRMLTLTGVGGVGKTRLALHVATAVHREFPAGVWLVDLAELQDPALVPYAVTEAMGIHDDSGRSQLTVLIESIDDWRRLLVLDNCEHVADACAALLGALLGASEELRVLATSRQALGVSGERIWRVPPLSVAGVEYSAAPSEAVELFADRAAAVDPRFSLTPQNREVVEALCRRLDGIPLAIELAAVRLRSLSPQQLMERVDNRFQLLTRGKRGARPRQQTLRATVDWSYDLCSPEEQSLWPRLSVFSGTFDVDAVHGICAGGGLNRAGIRDALEGLVHKSILTRDARGDAPRYHLLQTLQQYGKERLRESGQEVALRRRHRDWYARFAEQGERDWFSPRQRATHARTELEQPNLRAALQFCLTEPGEAQAGLGLAGTLWFFWVGCGCLSEGRYWLNRVLALDTEPTHARAKALWVGGYIAILQGDTSSALEMLAECRSQAERTGDRIAVAYVIHRIGCAALIGDEHTRAAALFSEAIACYDALGELNSNVIMARVELAMTRAFEGDLDLAVTLAEQVRATCEPHGEQWALSYALYVIAFAEWKAGKVAEAIAHARQCLRINHAFHDLIGVVLPIELLALFATSDGSFERVATLHGAAHRIWPAVGLPLFGSKYFNAPHKMCEELARRRLGDEKYESAFQEGSALGLDAAVACALGDEWAYAALVDSL